MAFWAEKSLYLLHWRQITHHERRDGRLVKGSFTKKKIASSFPYRFVAHHRRKTWAIRINCFGKYS
jgi:hypothetical protein